MNWNEGCIRRCGASCIGQNPIPAPIDNTRRPRLVRGPPRRLIQYCRPIAVPAAIAFTPALPKTRSGKIMRRPLQAQELGPPPGAITPRED